MSKSFILFALIAAIALCVGHSAAASTSRSRYNTERVYDFTVSDDKSEATWTAYGRQWTVHLSLTDITEDNTDYFHGTLEGDENAIVSFALLPGTGLSGMIIEGTETWWIDARPLEENGNSDAEDALGIFMSREDHSQLPIDAVVPPLAEPIHPPVNSISSSSSSSAAAATESTEGEVAAEPEIAISGAAPPQAKRRVTSYKVGVFFDQKWATASNNPWSSQADTIGLFNDVNAIYKAANLGTFSVVYGKQVTNSLTSISDMLTYFSNTASANIAAFSDSSYTSYAWLVGTNVGGLAYVGTSCKGTSAKQTTKTGVMGLVNYSRLWTVKTIAHELGHNRGAVHQFDDQCSGSVTTNCQCALMSYCFPSATNNPMGAVNYLSSLNIGNMTAAGCY